MDRDAIFNVTLKRFLEPVGEYLNDDRVSEIMINGRALAANVVSSQQMKILLTNSVISGPGSVSVKVTTPSGNSSDLGCSSGGTTSALTLTVN